MLFFELFRSRAGKALRTTVIRAFDKLITDFYTAAVPVVDPINQFIGIRYSER
jgi:hypothetical protein